MLLSQRTLITYSHTMLKSYTNRLIIHTFPEPRNKEQRDNLPCNRMLFLFSIGRHVNKSQYKVVNNVQCLRGIICKLVVSESWFLCPDWLIGDSGTINL